MKGWVLLALLGCAAVPTPAGISYDLKDCLEHTARMPLGVRCQCVVDARRRCNEAGLPWKCYADGWNDKDLDGFTMAACRKEG
jgi:hypothetical protein